MTMNTRPKADEYVPLAEQYIRLVPEGNLIEILHSQHELSKLVLQDLSEDQGAYKYAEDKWSLKTVVGHIADVERLWNYRVLRIARGDIRELPGYDRDIFALSTSYEDITLADVLEDLSAVRKSTISLLRNLRGEAFLHRGEFNDHPLSARAAAYIIAGHETHHMNIIQARYLIR